MRKMNTILVISIALGCIAVLCCVIADGIEPTSLVQGKPQETLESDSKRERAKRYEEPVTAFSTGDTDQKFSVPNGGPEADVKIEGPTATITITTTDGGPVALTITVTSIDGVLRYYFDTASVTFSNSVDSVTIVTVTVGLSSTGPTVTFDKNLLQSTWSLKFVEVFRMLIVKANAPEGKFFNQVTHNFVGPKEAPLIRTTYTGLLLGFTLISPPKSPTCPKGQGSQLGGLDVKSLTSGVDTGALKEVSYPH